jgi:2-polyprenyl-3-methyl-5-hydroxy-6-metoxy-1,4-benzoquinol methylase
MSPGPVPIQPRSGLASGRLIRARCRLAAGQVTGRSVLDGGCNVADLADNIPSNVDYVGMERDERIAAIARGLHPERRIECADLEAPWPASVTERRFDHVVLMAVLEHLKDPAAVLARARAVLAPGGTVIASTPHPRARALHRLGARWGLFSRDADEEHEIFWSRAQLEALGRAAGLRPLRYRRFQLGLNQLMVWAVV